jgi:uncharacterized membrane protein YphA (DoxX/SURF4 family)
MIALREGAYYLTAPDSPTLIAWTAGLLAVIVGALLLLGFLTPVGSAMAGLGCAGLAFSWFAPPVPNLIEQGLCAMLVITVSIAIVLLGPGALSIDARLFGRREIIIPRPVHRPQDS